MGNKITIVASWSKTVSAVTHTRVYSHILIKWKNKREVALVLHVRDIYLYSVYIAHEIRNKVLSWHTRSVLTWKLWFFVKQLIYVFRIRRTDYHTPMFHPISWWNWRHRRSMRQFHDTTRTWCNRILSHLQQRFVQFRNGHLLDEIALYHHNNISCLYFSPVEIFSLTL